MARTRAAMIVLVSLLMTACATPARVDHTESVGGNAPLAGTHWTLKTLGSDAMPRTPTVTLDFDLNGRITGNDGCNEYQGAYAADSGTIEIGHNLAATLMACPDPVEAQARAYIAALKRAAHFTVDDIGLSLRDGMGRRLATFVPAVSSLLHTNWEVIAYNNGKQGVVSLLPGTRVSVSFGDGGRVTGNAGCNEYFATYKVDGQAMSIGMPATTRKFCAEPEGLMQQEALYLDALKSASTFRLNGDRLELRAQDGALAATLNRSAGE
jgi:heat shock protein HslJ